MEKRLAGKLSQPKAKKLLLEVMGSLKPTFPIDVDEAIELARMERAREIVKKLKELENR